MKRIVSIGLLYLFLMSVPSLAAMQESPVGELARLLQGTNPPGSEVTETPLGNIAADAVREAARTDAAIVNGGYIAANLQPGEVYADDIAAVFSERERIVIVTLTQAELRDWLETGVSHITVGPDERIDLLESAFEGFPQVSGFSFRYDASAPAGERIMELVTESDAASVSLACPASMAAGAFGYAPKQAQPTEFDLVSAMTAFFAGRTVEPPESGRSECVGTADNTIIRQYPALLFILVMLGLVVLFARNGRKKKWLDI